MSNRVLETLTIIALVGSGIVGGVFFAFSTFVMRALDRLQHSRSIAAMQAINRAAPNAWFMVALFGTALVCLVLAIDAIVHWGHGGSGYRLAAGILYLVAVVVTIGYHIPRNNALATLDPNAASTITEWTRYSAGWTAWNHVRTVTPLAATVLFAVALRMS
jgi:uncharacterized membrane protein